MSLPGHLEVLMAEEEVTSGDEGGGAGGGAAGGDELAAEWLDKVGLSWLDWLVLVGCFSIWSGNQSSLPKGAMPFVR
jgi:hypothetical protein